MLSLFMKIYVYIKNTQSEDMKKKTNKIKKDKTGNKSEKYFEFIFKYFHCELK